MAQAARSDLTTPGRRGGSHAMRACGLVAAVALLAFAPVLRFSFAYDDHWTIVANRFLAAPPLALMRALWSRSAQMPDATRPAMVLSAKLDRVLFGLSPAGYHAHSLLLYAALCGVVFFTCFLLTRRRSTALYAALLYAVLPIHAEPVAAINYREDLLASLGMLGALLALAWPSTARLSLARTIAAPALLLLGLCAKESAVGVLVLGALLAPALRVDRAWLRRREAALLALAGVLVLWGLWRASSLGAPDDVPRSALPLASRAMQAGRYFAWAATGSALPLIGAPLYAELAADGIGVGLLAVALAVLGLAFANRRAPWAAPVLWLFGTTLVTSPFVGPFNARADRYLLLSSMAGALGWAMLIDAGVRSLRASGRKPPPAFVAVLACAAIAWLLVLDRRAASPWRNDLTLWTAAIEAEPRHAKAWTGLAFAQRRLGRITEASASVEHALALDDAYGPALVEAVFVAVERGERERAAALIERARRVETRGRALEVAERCLERPSSEARACLAGR